MSQAPGRPVRVLCVDDNEFVTDAMRRRLAAEPGLEFVGAAFTSDHLAEEARRTGADLVLLDMHMPGCDPLEALRELRDRCPEIRAVAVSGYLREDIIDQALEAGAMGYLSKSEEIDTIVDSIRRAAAGEVVFSPEVLKHYARGGG